MTTEHVQNLVIGSGVAGKILAWTPHGKLNSKSDIRSSSSDFGFRISDFALQVALSMTGVSHGTL